MRLSDFQAYLYATPFRKHLFLSGLIVATFTIVYVVKSIVDGVSLGLMDKSYRNGQADTIDRIIDQAVQKDCQPFNVHVGERKAYLVNLECVQATAGSGSTANGWAVTTGSNGATYIQGKTQ